MYCSVGYRSEKVSEKLIKAGSNMYGSIFEWVNQGRPVYDSDGVPTDRVHAFDETWGAWLLKGEKVFDNAKLLGSVVNSFLGYVNYL